MTLHDDPLAALAGQEHAVKRLNAIAHDPPQSIVIEGGDADSRLALSLYWAMRLNCESGHAKRHGPCGHCPACKQIAAFAFNDLLFYDGREGADQGGPGAPAAAFHLGTAAQRGRLPGDHFCRGPDVHDRGGQRPAQIAGGTAPPATCSSWPRPSGNGCWRPWSPAPGWLPWPGRTIVRICPR